MVGAAACAQAPAVGPAPEPVAVNAGAYGWLDGISVPRHDLAPLGRVFPAPSGCERVEVEPGGFAEWLRGLPIRLDRTAVLDYRGRILGAASAGVLALDLGRGDLQQCADTLIRLHAEYLWAAGRAGGARYHFTSGDLSSYGAWLEGERFSVRGSEVRRLGGEPRPRGRESFRGWLQHLYLYAGTLSLGLDSVRVPTHERIRPGDFFVEPGSPGHAVIVLDVVRAEDGSHLGLIGQGFTPAQEAHVIRGSGALEGVWFRLPKAADESLDVPTWSPFPREACRRFTDVER